MFALVDCNNFYASCERVFRPDLQKTPIAVLSNNDGCIIARSAEVKAMGIPMGAPYFKCKQELAKAGVAIFSSNYELYGDMSHRVVETLRHFSPELEVYSIDECFLSLKGFENNDLLQYGHKMRQTVKQWTGIPVGVGIAPTKTLAKVANKMAKLSDGVCLIVDAAYSQQILQQFPVGDLWGVGRRYSKMLNEQGITMAAQLCAMPDKWISQKLTVQGLRMVYELRGISCIPLEEMPDDQKALAVTRSFSKRITEWHEMHEAIVHYITRAGEKLRRQGLTAGYMQVFLHTSRFSKDPYYGNAIGIKMPLHTDYTPELIALGAKLLRQIFREGFRYAKAGVVLSDLIRGAETQDDLLAPIKKTEQKTSLMLALDTINRRMGKHTVYYAGAGIHKSWSMNRKMVSPNYTTRWAEIRVI